MIRSIVLGVCFLLVCVWAYLNPISARLLVPLLVAGGLGSVVQSLIEKKDILTLPAKVDDDHFNLGCVSDLIIGMVGAFASLIIGLTVLNERFFVYVPSSAPPGSAAAAAFEEIARLIPTWVRIASFGALTGFASRRLLPDLSNKVANMVSGALDQQVRNQDENARTQAELIGLVVKSADPKPKPATEAHSQAASVALAKNDPPPPPVEALVPLVDRFALIDLNTADDQKRDELKRQVADGIPGVAREVKATSADILGRILALAGTDPKVQGWLVGLASVIAVDPDPADGLRLLQVAGLASQSFVKSRVLLALYTLKARHLLGAAETRSALSFLRFCMIGNDASLQRRATAMVAMFQGI